MDEAVTQFQMNSLLTVLINMKFLNQETGELNKNIKPIMCCFQLFKRKDLDWPRLWKNIYRIKYVEANVLFYMYKYFTHRHLISWYHILLLLIKTEEIRKASQCPKLDTT